MYVSLSVEKFVKELSSEAPYPGGGSAACLVGTLGIALALMVGRIVEKKKKNGVPENETVNFRTQLDKLADLEQQALRAIDGDIDVYKKVVQAYELDKESPQRAAKIEETLKEGYLFQKKFAEGLFQSAEIRDYIAGLAKGSIASDLVLSRHFLKASFLGALQTARVNLEYMKDEKMRTNEFEALRLLEDRFGAFEK